LRVSIILCAALLLASVGAIAESLSNQGIEVSKVSDWEISLKASGRAFHCRVDQKLSDIKLSSDRQAIIVSGTSYILVYDILSCDRNNVAHTKKAAPRVGFLSDVNIKSGIYASMIPVSANPMGFVALVAKIGSDESLINLPGFYRKGVKKNQFLKEASTNVNPKISKNGQFISLDLYDCGSGEYVDVVDVLAEKWLKLDRDSCQRLFNF